MTTYDYLRSRREPQFVEEISFENILAENILIVRQQLPDWDGNENSALYNIVKNFAAREYQIRQRNNGQQRQGTLRFSEGGNVDDIVILGAVVRNENEEDLPLKDRYIDNIEALSPLTNAGIIGNAKKAEGIIDATIEATFSNAGMTIKLYVVKENYQQLTAQERVAFLATMRVDKNSVPGWDYVAEDATITPYQIEVNLSYNSGEHDKEAIEITVRQNLYNLIDRIIGLGNGVFVDQIIGACNFVDGVLETTVAKPAADLPANIKTVYTINKNDTDVVINFTDVA